ncbi:MAG: hypothetical protein DHS20C09_15920 [marine bacterium B5-7]|nr:MAG: hypothetical protein DHS20C09_15920 [marine bacterium B5-7]
MRKSPQDWWPADGNNHKNINKGDIYINRKISRFLDQDRITLIVASKGMGKTLLMRVKKKILIDAKDGSLIIPVGKQAEKNEFDEPNLTGTFSAIGYESLLFWKGLWSSSIILSVLTNLDSGHELLEDGLFQKCIERLDIDEVFKRDYLQNLAMGEAFKPSHYLARLLHSYTESELYKFIKSSSVLDELSNKHITNSVIVLIDAFDQSLREAFPANQVAWKNGQLGLAKAAHSLFTTNHHLKTIATIRHEAWSAFEDDDREVIEGKSLFLDYEEQDLRNLFVKAIQQYTDADSIKEFFGLDSLINEYCSEEEDVFSYVCRHSTRSPRSLMGFGKAIDDLDLEGLNEEQRADLIKVAIDRNSSINIFDDYLNSQRAQFLKTLGDRARITALLKLIPSNVLTRSSLSSINKKFSEGCKLFQHDSHPFCELYNIGLLGQVRQDSLSGGMQQYFRRPVEFDWDQIELLNDSSIYVLHPGLTSAIVALRSIHLNRVNVVEDGRAWTNKKNHDGIPKIFVSYSSVDNDIVEPVIRRLQENMDLKYPSDFWFDKWKISGGEDIQREVEKGVANSDLVVLFASRESLKSGWVEKEWRSKYQEEIETSSVKVIVAIIDNSSPDSLPQFLRGKRALKISSSDWDVSVMALTERVAKVAAENLERLFPPVAIELG